MDIGLAKTLYLYAKGKDSRIQELEDAQDKAFKAILAGQGAQVISTTGNGVSVTFSSKSMTNQDWFNTISQALIYISNGGYVAKSKQGYIV